MCLNAEDKRLESALVFSKKQRIKKKEFKKIFQHGLLIRDKDILLRYLPRQNQFCRFAVNVSKKVSNKAVIRNKLRRQTQAIFRKNLSQFPKTVDLFVSFRSNFADFKELEDKLLSLIKKIN